MRAQQRNGQKKRTSITRERVFSLSITAEDSDDEPLAGLPVELKLAGIMVASGKTDRDGEVTFEGLMPGTYKIFANGEDTGEEADIERKNEDALIVYDGDYSSDATVDSETEDESEDEEDSDDDDATDEDLDEDKREEELDF